MLIGGKYKILLEEPRDILENLQINFSPCASFIVNLLQRNSLEILEMCNRILDLSHTPTLEQTLVRRPDPLVTTQYPENALFDGQFVFLYPHCYISVTQMESIP